MALPVKKCCLTPFPYALGLVFMMGGMSASGQAAYSAAEGSFWGGGEGDSGGGDSAGQGGGSTPCPQGGNSGTNKDGYTTDENGIPELTGRNVRMWGLNVVKTGAGVAIASYAPEAAPAIGRAAYVVADNGVTALMAVGYASYNYAMTHPDQVVQAANAFADGYTSGTPPSPQTGLLNQASQVAGWVGSRVFPQK